MPTEKGNQSESSSAEQDLQERLQRRRNKREERSRLRRENGEQPRKRATGRSRVRFDEEPPPERPRRARKKSPGPAPNRIKVQFDPDKIDDSAQKVVRRLTQHGYEAYLVGGCVRDLLVGHRPKDFDVATSARPEEVRALFRNSRIIGRRFRLVHVLFPGGHVIETATFRRNPPAPTGTSDEDLLIRSDNVFGDAHEDAQRRDFTINGLFYDVDEKTVLDWVGGMKHIEARTVETIGDPVVRFQEDPIRMLRAVKFAARIDFGIAPDAYEALVQCRGALAMAARPRLSEEILRLMRGGAAHRSIWLLWELGMLDLLVPELSSFIADSADDRAVWELLSEVDRRTKERGAPLDDIVLWCALLLEPLNEACHGAPDRLRAAQDFLEPIIERLNLPRRSSDSIRRIVAMLPRLAQGKAARFKKSPLFPIAREILELRGRTSADDAAFVETEEKSTAAHTPSRKGRTRRPRSGRNRS